MDPRRRRTSIDESRLEHRRQRLVIVESGRIRREVLIHRRQVMERSLTERAWAGTTTLKGERTPSVVADLPG
jgi:hypothetical protein